MVSKNVFFKLLDDKDDYISSQSSGRDVSSPASHVLSTPESYRQPAYKPANKPRPGQGVSNFGSRALSMPEPHLQPVNKPTPGQDASNPASLALSSLPAIKAKPLREVSNAEMKRPIDTKHRGRPYMHSEDVSIVKYVLKKELDYLDAVHLPYWMAAEGDPLLPPRTSASLHERFKKLVSRLQEFGVSSEVVRKIRGYFLAKASVQKTIREELRGEKDPDDRCKPFTRREDQAIMNFVKKSNGRPVWSVAETEKICPGRKGINMYVRYTRIKNRYGDYKKIEEPVSSDEDDPPPGSVRSTREKRKAASREVSGSGWINVEAEKTYVAKRNAGVFRASARKRRRVVLEDDSTDDEVELLDDGESVAAIEKAAGQLQHAGTAAVKEPDQAALGGVIGETQPLTIALDNDEKVVLPVVVSVDASLTPSGVEELIGRGKAAGEISLNKADAETSKVPARRVSVDMFTSTELTGSEDYRKISSDIERNRNPVVRLFRCDNIVRLWSGSHSEEQSQEPAVKRYGTRSSGTSNESQRACPRSLKKSIVESQNVVVAERLVTPASPTKRPNTRSCDTSPSPGRSSSKEAATKKAETKQVEAPKSQSLLRTYQRSPRKRTHTVSTPELPPEPIGIDYTAPDNVRGVELRSCQVTGFAFIMEGEDSQAIIADHPALSSAGLTVERSPQPSTRLNSEDAGSSLDQEPSRKLCLKPDSSPRTRAARKTAAEDTRAIIGDPPVLSSAGLTVERPPQPSENAGTSLDQQPSRRLCLKPDSSPRTRAARKTAAEDTRAIVGSQGNSPALPSIGDGPVPHRSEDAGTSPRRTLRLRPETLPRTTRAVTKTFTPPTSVDWQKSNERTMCSAGLSPRSRQKQCFVQSLGLVRQEAPIVQPDKLPKELFLRNDVSDSYSEDVFLTCPELSLTPERPDEKSTLVSQGVSVGVQTSPQPEPQPELETDHSYAVGVDELQAAAILALQALNNALVSDSPQSQDSAVQYSSGSSSDSDWSEQLNRAKKFVDLLKRFSASYKKA